MCKNFPLTVTSKLHGVARISIRKFFRGASTMGAFSSETYLPLILVLKAILFESKQGLMKKTLSSTASPKKLIIIRYGFAVGRPPILTMLNGCTENL